MNHMVSQLCLLLVALSSLGSLSEARHSSQCLPPFGKMPFDAAKFSGKWFVVGHIMSANMPRAPVACSRVDYNLHESGNITRVVVDYTMQFGGKEVNVTMTGQPIHPGVLSAVHAVMRGPEDKTHGAGVMTQTILASDYTSFAIFYACKPLYVDAVDIFAKMEVVGVWSRQPVMDATLLSVLKTVLSGYDFDADAMLMSDNSSCQ